MNIMYLGVYSYTKSTSSYLTPNTLTPNPITPIPLPSKYHIQGRARGKRYDVLALILQLIQR